MVKLKRKIKIVDSLPLEKKKKFSIVSILSTIIILLMIYTIIYFCYIKITPYINAVDIKKIAGKKTNITECNTKDYIIINKDKSYSLLLTDNKCNQKHYEGNVIIKNNNIIFNKNIEGLVDNNYNIVINNNVFESDKNEWRNKKYFK